MSSRPWLVSLGPDWGLPVVLVSPGPNWSLLVVLGLAAAFLGLPLAPVATHSKVIHSSHPYHSLDISILKTGCSLVIFNLTLGLNRKYYINGSTISMSFIISHLI